MNFNTLGRKDAPALRTPIDGATSIDGATKVPALSMACQKTGVGAGVPPNPFAGVIIDGLDFHTAPAANHCRVALAGCGWNHRRIASGRAPWRLRVCRPGGSQNSIGHQRRS